LKNLPDDANTPDIPPPSNDDAHYAVMATHDDLLATLTITLDQGTNKYLQVSSLDPWGSRLLAQIVRHLFSDEYIVADSCVTLSAKLTKKVSDKLKRSYAQRISPGSLLAVESFNVALAMKKVGDGYRKNVRLSLTGLRGKGLYPSKGVVNAASLEGLEKSDFVADFFDQQELNLSQSESLSAIPPEIAAASFSSQPPPSVKADERSKVTNDAQEDETLPSTPPRGLATVERTNRDKRDQATDAIAVQGDAITAGASSNVADGEGAWIRDFPQSVQYWGVSHTTR
jgi:hypothetical protein